MTRPTTVAANPVVPRRRTRPSPLAGAPETIFLCPPDHYDVVYSINPWMDLSVGVDRARARRQWQCLVGELERRGAALELVEPAAGCPDMVFLGDAGVVVGNRFLCSRFRHPERQAESDHYARWFAGAGYEVTRVEAPAVLEGLGDVALSGRRAILGHGPRSNAAGFDALRRFLPDLDVVAELELPDPRFYHLATALVFLDRETILYAPQALTLRGLRDLRASGLRRIEVSDEDLFEHQACNCVVLDRTVLLDGCSDALRGELGEHGFTAVTSPASEFKKGGGSLRCLVLPALDVEPAASSRWGSAPHRVTP